MWQLIKSISSRCNGLPDCNRLLGAAGLQGTDEAPTLENTQGATFEWVTAAMALAFAARMQGSAIAGISQPLCSFARPAAVPRRARVEVDRIRMSAAAPSAPAVVQAETQVPGMTQFLDSLKYDRDGLVAVVAQHIDTGEVLMQAFADRAALNETMQTGLGTFYSRSRKQRWCKGETSGHFLKVQRVFVDCDRDSIIYLCDPVGPACHTGARTCWFSEVSTSTSSDAGSSAAQGSGQSHVCQEGDHTHTSHMPASTLLMLERTIEERRAAMSQPIPPGGKPSWTAKLLGNPELLCKKVREEAGELCQTLEANEGKERAASEMADLLYHSMVLCNLQGVAMEDVLRVLRKRFGTSGIEEKASRPPKQQA